MEKRETIKSLVKAFADQQMNRTGGGHFGHAETGAERLTLDQVVERIEFATA